jgi:hypothetical protein
MVPERAEGPQRRTGPTVNPRRVNYAVADFLERRKADVVSSSPDWPALSRELSEEMHWGGLLPFRLPCGCCEVVAIKMGADAGLTLQVEFIRRRTGETFH